jgi:hypothetical protein
MTMPSLTGNTFYFGRLSQGTISPYNSTFEKCNTSYAGGIFYLYKGQVLNEELSKFRMNAAVYGGVLYCDHCVANFKTSTLFYNAAKEASLVYIWSVGQAVPAVTYTNCTMTDGFAANVGGGIVTRGTALGYINLFDCALIRNF